MQRNIETTLPDTISVVRTTKISNSSKVHDAKTSRKATTPISHQTLIIKVHVLYGLSELATRYITQIHRSEARG